MTVIFHQGTMEIWRAFALCKLLKHAQLMVIESWDMHVPIHPQVFTDLGPFAEPLQFPLSAKFN